MMGILRRWLLLEISAGAAKHDGKHDDLLWESMRYKISWVTKD